MAQAVIELASLDGTNGFRLNGIDAFDLSGFSVAGAGDVNADGIDDLIIGAPNAAPGGRSLAGETYVIFGTTAGFSASLDLAALDGTNGFRLDGIGGAPEVKTLRAVTRWPPSTRRALPEPPIQSDPPLESRISRSAAMRRSSGSTAATCRWRQRQAGYSFGNLTVRRASAQLTGL